MTNITKIFLVLNSGSSSEKFSLYEGEDEVCSLYFEGIEVEGKKQFICTITRADGTEEKIDKSWETLDVAFKEAKEIFEKEGYINEAHPLDGILVRVVAAGKYFSQNHIVDDETMKELEKVRIANPLHVPGTERGIKNARETFAGVPIIVMSDSESLVKESRKDMKYALPKELVEEFNLGRWGAHGASNGAVGDDRLGWSTSNDAARPHDITKQGNEYLSVPYHDEGKTFIDIAAGDKAVQFRDLGIGADNRCEDNMVKSQSGNLSLAHLMYKILCVRDIDAVLEQHPAVGLAFHNKRNQLSHRIQIPYQKTIISVAKTAFSSF